MKDDEKRFLIDMYKHSIKPRDLIKKPNFYISYKRALYLLRKWTNKGWYDYGVSVDLGWLTSMGVDIAKSLL